MSWGFRILVNMVLAIGLVWSMVISASTRPYIIVEYALPDTLDPIKMNNVPSLVASNLLYDGLVKFNPDLMIESDIAKSWETSKDGKTITFLLNPNAKFQNGERIQSEDVVFSLKRLLSAKSIVKNLYDCIDSIKGISSDKVELKLKWAYPPIFGILAGSTAKILPRKYTDKKDFFNNPIGSGPFKLTKTDSTTFYFESNDSYFFNKPKLKNIILKSSESEEEAKKIAKVNKADDLSRWPLNSTDAVFKKGQKISSPVLETWIFGIVVTIKPFNELEIRKSFRASFDQEKFRKTFYPEALPSFGYIPIGVAGSKSKTERLNIQIGKISKMPIHIAFPSQLSKSNEMKKFIENEFNSKGWNVTVDLMEWNELMAGYSSKKHQSFFLSMNMDYPDADFLLKNFESNNTDNFSGVNNPKIDKVIREMRITSDRDKRNKLYEEAIQIVDDEALTINVFHPRNNYWISKCVKGFTSNLLSSVYIDYRNVYFDENCLKSEGM